MPPLTQEEHDYYTERHILEDYERFVQRNNASCAPSAGQITVELLFTEFVIVIFRIGLLVGDGPNTPKKLENFLNEKMGILPIPNQFTMKSDELEAAWFKLQSDSRSNKLNIDDAVAGIYSESEDENQD